MANYYSAMRTNYFRVKDEDKFRELMNRVVCSEDSIEVWSQCDKDGNKYFGFGAYGSISGLTPEDGEDEELEYDDFVEALQGCVADDDAIIIFDVGHEKLRYVGGSADIITSKENRYVALRDAAVKAVSEMLGNDVWDTKCDY